MKKRILVISDNIELINAFSSLIEKYTKEVEVAYAFSYNNSNFLSNNNLKNAASALNLKEQWQNIVIKYDLVFSLHCKQLFPIEMVKAIKCINVHPGYNPFNRGWFPQIFSILNQLPAGATIHEIDEQLDHGAIIAQKQVSIESWETSIDVYNKVLQTEIELLEKCLPLILNNSYIPTIPHAEGNINLKKDFKALCQLDLSEKLTMREAIDRLRALTHGEYKNAWFIDPSTQKKVFVSINFEMEND